MMHPGRQDWDPVVLRKKAATSSERRDEGAVNAVSNVNICMLSHHLPLWAYRGPILGMLAQFKSQMRATVP